MPDNTEYLKINITSIPEKGKANQELISWLAKKINIAKSDISIISGELDRLKKLLITSKNSDVLENIKKLIS